MYNEAHQMCDENTFCAFQLLASGTGTWIITECIVLYNIAIMHKVSITAKAMNDHPAEPHSTQYINLSVQQQDKYGKCGIQNTFVNMHL